MTKIVPMRSDHSPQNFRDHEGRVYTNHISASQIRTWQPVAFERFFKFCFERHPVDKCLSHFAMLKNSSHHDNARNPRKWHEYLERGNFPVDTPKYIAGAEDSGENRLLVDKIYRYEELDAALEDISRRTGSAHAPLLELEKSGYRVGVPSFDQVMAEPCERSIIFKAFESSLKFTPYG